MWAELTLQVTCTALTLGYSVIYIHISFDYFFHDWVLQIILKC